jgi:UPF0755 protein
MKYSSKQHKKFNKPVLILLSVVSLILVFLLILGIALGVWYKDQLKPKTSESVLITINIPMGYSTSEIADLLEEKKVIKSSTAFEWYIRSHDLRESLKAGEYQLDSSKSTADIVEAIAGGKIKKELFTIIPGQRMDQIKQSMIKFGFTASEIDSAFNPSNYQNYPAIIAKPANSTLEGYLYPESYQTTSNTNASDIVKASLDQMSKILTPDLINAFQKQGLGIHQAITLASIVEKEVSNINDRRMVAGLFLNRIKKDIPLGSDVTYKYAAFLTGQSPSPLIDSPYNTYKYQGLPPGPISNVSKSAIEAVAYPIKTDYLFFVNGDDGKTYFSMTQQEHEALAKQHCKQLCSTY